MKEPPACYTVFFPAFMERWLNDGGASDNEAAYEAGGFSPLQFFRP
jgi:hypothetical protein